MSQRQDFVHGKAHIGPLRCSRVDSVPDLNSLKYVFHNLNAIGVYKGFAVCIAHLKPS